MTAQTTTQRTAAHRRRMAEKMARYEGALREIDELAFNALESVIDRTDALKGIATKASQALNPTDPAKS